jgi:hypothetical protein
MRRALVLTTISHRGFGGPTCTKERCRIVLKTPNRGEYHRIRPDPRVRSHIGENPMCTMTQHSPLHIHISVYISQGLRWPRDALSRKGSICLQRAQPDRCETAGYILSCLGAEDTPRHYCFVKDGESDGRPAYEEAIVVAQPQSNSLNPIHEHES